MFEKKGKKLLEDAGIVVGGDNPWDVKVHDTSIYRDAFLRGTLGFGDGYTNGKWDCAELDQFFTKILQADQNKINIIVDVFQTVRDQLINTQAGKRAFQVGECHYDLGNEMYALMLGESMGYSSGMYLKQDDDLTAAQYNKFDALCKKLELKPGMKVLEIGAGWGTFARHAAEHYGVEVVGLTVSKEQKKFAEERCQGLTVEFLLLDYQKLPEKYNAYFDRVISIEMIEAVGKKNFKVYFNTITRALKENGLVGIQAIMGRGEPDSFISTRIFPNGVLPSTKNIADNIKDILRIKHWESFGKDYDRTLMAWDVNFRENWAKIKIMTDKEGKLLYDEKFYRMWRFYLMSCAGVFRSGTVDVAQIVFSKQNGLSAVK